MAERQVPGLQRVLGVNALFATAYGNVGSSIYYALGLVASFALGLTPIVFITTGVIFYLTAADLRRGDRDVSRGWRLLELRAPRIQRVLVVLRGLGPDAQLHASRSPSRRSSSLTTSAACSGRSLKTSPGDIFVGIGVVVLLCAINIVGVKEAARAEHRAGRRRLLHPGAAGGRRSACWCSRRTSSSHNVHLGSRADLEELRRLRSRWG